MLCLEAATGALLWSVDVPSAAYASGTPVADNIRERLFVTTTEGLICVDTALNVSR